MAVDERTFNADVVGWINEILGQRPDLPFSRAAFEEHGITGRRDFTIYARSPRLRKVLTGELKVPDKPYGKSAYDLNLVSDAQKKANELGVSFFFTWNVNQLVLWRTFAENTPIDQRDLEHFEVASLRSSDQLNHEATREQMKDFVRSFLERFTEILQGSEPIRNRPPDEKFIRIIESALASPILDTQDALDAKYFADAGFRTNLGAWMRDVQGWTLSDIPEIQRQNLDRAAQLSSYILLNKIVFYETLRRRFSMLPPFDRHRFGSAASELGAEVRRVFARAMEVSHDYETIYAEDFGSTIPFLSDEAAAGWRDLIGQVELFDFTRMDYDVIGRIFERLIDPEERHRYGQHYTRPEIVDVVNAFCIHDPDAEVLDSSCGGGTFLVRAYARKRFLARRLGREPYHPELLSQLNGVDISQFAVHLSAVNLATRHLIDEANYPRIAHKDFFDVRRGTTLITLPVVSEGLGSGQRQDISLDLLDAVVGNPPYIRQEQLGRPYKDKLRTLLAEEYRTDPSPPRLSGRSDIHVYFWPHAAQFLKDGSFLGLLTSSTWMDVEYGFRLQEFLLRHFRIVAILESEVEPWFTEARVITAVTILQKEPSLANRDANMVRFVLLRKPIAEILGPATDEPTSQVNAENLAARILAVSANESNETWRVRLISQEALWAEGTRVPVDASDLETTASGSINETDEEDETDDDQPEMLDDEPEADQPLVPTEYIGSKWGIYLRAPDIYFTLLERSQATMVPLGTIATVKFGIKSGKDAFFFVRDITENERKLTKTEQAFRDKWSISYADTQRIRIVQSGDKSAHLVEARFLEPEFQRLTEAQNVVLRAVNVRKMTLAVNRTLSRLQGTRIAEYIRYGERQGWNEGSTVKGRKLWYDLGLLPKGQRAQMFWSMSHQYRHIAPLNVDGIICNHNLFDLWAGKDVEYRVLWAILNSTAVALSKIQFGRPVGREGILKTEVVDVKMMLVPDPRRATPEIAARLQDAMDRISARPIRPIIEEFPLADRQALDDAVLELLGISLPEERTAIRTQLYGELTAFYQGTRRLEIQAMGNRMRTARQGRVTPTSLAEELWAEVDINKLRVFPDGFLNGNEECDVIDLPPGKLEVGRQMFALGAGLAAGTVAVDGIRIDAGTLPRAEFLSALNEYGLSGNVSVPLSDQVCTDALKEFREFQMEQRQRFTDLAATRTGNPQTQRAVIRALERRSQYWRPG